MRPREFLIPVIAARVSFALLWDAVPRLAVFVLDLAAALATASCANPPQQPYAHTFDPCETAIAPEGLRADQLAQVQAAMDLWNGAADLRLQLASRASPELGRVPIVSQSDAGAFHGFYDDVHATVFINDQLDAASAPVVIAHELGHSFGLFHVSPDERPSLMNPGNLDVTPTPQDAAELFSLWRPCSARPAAQAAAVTALKLR